MPVPSAEGSEATEEEEGSEGEQKKGKKGGRARKAKKGRKPKSSKDTSDKDTSDKGFVERLTSASPYTVMLAISLLAMIIAVFLLFAELKWGYDLDIKANTLKEKLGAAPPAVQVEPPNTTAVA